MGIIEFCLITLVVGLVVWAIWTFTPIPAPFKKLILWAAIVVLVILLLNALGIVGKDVTIPKIK